MNAGARPREFDPDQFVQDIDEDATGWTGLDACKALSHCGFVERTIADAKGWSVSHRYHPQHLDLDVLIYSPDELPPVVARRVAYIIRESRLRSGRP